jgi:hypothetical protein
MLGQFVGHRPRVTVYFGLLAAGLSLIAAGLEAARLAVVGPLDPSASAGYAAVGLSAGLAMSFLAAYVNESLVSGWLVGAVPAAGRVGGLTLQGTAVGSAAALYGTAGVGFVVGGVSYGLAAEKLRRETVAADLQAATPRVTSTALALASVGLGIACLVVVPTL